MSVTDWTIRQIKWQSEQSVDPFWWRYYRKNHNSMQPNKPKVYKMQKFFTTLPILSHEMQQVIPQQQSTWVSMGLFSKIYCYIF